MAARTRALAMIKTFLVALMLVTVSAAVVPGTATAASEFQPITSTAQSKDQVEIGGHVDALYDCFVFYPIPAYYVDFNCTVYSGAIRLHIDCSNGASFASDILRALGSYLWRGTCGPPWTVTGSRVEHVPAQS